MSEIIVLDTHIWLWFVNNDINKIPQGWLERIEHAQKVGISAVSYYEVALANSRGRLKLPMKVQDWFDCAVEAIDLELFPLTADIAYRSVMLSPIHKDPFDRMIIATALSYEAKLASVDKIFPKYNELKGCLMSTSASTQTKD